MRVLRISRIFSDFQLENDCGMFQVKNIIKSLQLRSIDMRTNKKCITSTTKKKQPHIRHPTINHNDFCWLADLSSLHLKLAKEKTIASNNYYNT